jgi:sigma-B regulation protein RsbU (phosphoserine phosphatase)
MSNARAIQMALVPNKFPPYPERGDIDIYGMMEPAKSVGGDLFDYCLRDDRLFFCIGDVSGKGMPAALLMAVMKTMFRSEARRNDHAAAIVGMMNSTLCEENTEDYFVTMFVGILDLATGRLDYCNAGHEAPLVNGSPLSIKRNKPIGALADWTFEGQEAQLQRGDMLFLYTDGLSEARNQTGKRFGRAHVAELVAGHPCDTAEQLVRLTAQEVHRYAADTEQSDDITLLAVKWSAVDDSLPASGAQLSLQPTMDDIGRLKPFVTEAASQAGIDAKEAKRLRAAVEEAVANVINYSQATFIDLDAFVSDTQLKVTITDDGIPFDATAESPTDFSLPPDQRPPGGLGMMFLHQMTDQLDYQRIDNRNVLTIVKTFNLKPET